jgi:uncharacterized protein
MAPKTVIDTNFLIALKELPNVHYAHVYFRWNPITDADDNKFVDCYAAAGADYLLSNDSHFSILKNIAFPKINVLKLDEFETLIKAIIYP